MHAGLAALCVPGRYCPARSAAPNPVPSGHYSLPESVDTAEIRTGIQVCGPGSFCVTGHRWPCPGGTYNDSSGRASVCSTPCPPGECSTLRVGTCKLYGAINTEDLRWSLV
jgi:hypothetical protein